MQLSWLGQSCFKIQTKDSGEIITIITDPYNKNIGFKAPNFEATIVTISHNHEDHNNYKSLRADPYLVDSAGEYDVKNICIQGIESFHDNKKGEERGINIIYRFEIENISISHLGDLGHELDDKQLEVLVGTDILLIPVGGKYTIGARDAAKIINQVEPRIIIPMHYKIPGLTVDIDDEKKFVKELGIKPTEEDRLKITKKDLPQEDMELIILKKQ